MARREEDEATDDGETGVGVTDTRPPGHWQLLRDLLAFQFKLLLDAGRDFLLSPLSFAAVAIGMLTSRDNPGSLYYALLRLGRRSDHWINLFDTHSADDRTSDEYVRRVEDIVKREYERGGVVRQFKDQTDKVIDRLGANRERNPDDDA